MNPKPVLGIWVENTEITQTLNKVSLTKMRTLIKILCFWISLQRFS